MGVGSKGCEVAFELGAGGASSFRMGHFSGDIRVLT